MFTVLKVAKIALIMLALITVAPVSEPAATDDTLTPVSYLPYVRKESPVPPAPHNFKARDVVLQLSDMPSGYSLDESGPMDFSDTLLEMGAVDGYEVEFSNLDLLFSGTPMVVNSIIVFTATEGAQDHINMVKDNINADPEMTQVSCPVLADETVAARLAPEDGIAVAYLVVFRKDNLTGVIATGGLFGVAKFDTALQFAETSWAKVRAQISQ